ncbi:MAG: hypothetical protein QM695_11370 [Micropruina sp.]
MTEDQDPNALRARVSELEAENRAPRQASSDATPSGSRGKARVRVAIAALLIAISVILAPVAVIGAWVRAQLVDTDTFVQTFTPLASEPAVQSFITDQVTQAINEKVDIDTLVNDLMGGLGQLNLPPRAKEAAVLLTGPAVDGVRSLIRSAVERTVASPQFAQLWALTLRESHTRAIAIIQGDPNRAVQLSDDGALSLELGTVIRQVRQVLVDQGFPFAHRIPEIERSLPIVAADSLAPIRSLYQVLTALGYWLPWIVLGLLAAGLAAAPRRVRALAWAGLGYMVAFSLLAAGLGIGRRFFVSTVSPSIMPAATAEVLFGQVIELIYPAVSALVMLSVLIAVGAWLFGASRPAVALRTAGDRAFASVRAAADRNGLGTGSFGRGVERWRSAILVVTVAISVGTLFLRRPASMENVLGTLAVVLLVLLIVELVRRPDLPPVREQGNPPAALPH